MKILWGLRVCDIRRDNEGNKLYIKKRGCEIPCAGVFDSVGWGVKCNLYIIREGKRRMIGVVEYKKIGYYRVFRLTEYGGILIPVVFDEDIDIYRGYLLHPYRSFGYVLHWVVIGNKGDFFRFREAVGYELIKSAIDENMIDFLVKITFLYRFRKVERIGCIELKKYLWGGKSIVRLYEEYSNPEVLEGIIMNE